MADDNRQGKPSASAMSRYKHCEGAYQLSQGVEEFRTPEIMALGESGDRIHAYLAKDFSADDLKAEELEIAEQCSAIERETLRLVLKDRAEFGIEHREQRLWLKSGNVKLMSGKADLIVVDEVLRIGVVLDYKSAYGDQDPAEENYQLRTLIVLGSEEYPGLEWYGGIIQPLISKKCQLVKYTADDVALAKQELITILDKIHKPEAQTTAGPWCRFCPAALKCPSVQAMLQAFGLINAASAEGEAMAAYLNLCKSAKPIIKRIEERAKSMLKADPASVPGWQIGKPETRRTITDPFECFRLLSEAEPKLIDRETFLKDCVSVGVGDLEKGVQKFTGMKPKESKDSINAYCVPVFGFKEIAGSLEQV